MKFYFQERCFIFIFDKILISINVLSFIRLFISFLLFVNSNSKISSDLLLDHHFNNSRLKELGKFSNNIFVLVATF